MESSAALKAIREKLFQGSADYTKNQPDLFLPHRFRMLAPSQSVSFLERVREALKEEKEVLIYVHFPFCFSECLFCNSFPQKAEKKIQGEYLDKVLKEIELLALRGVLEGKKARCVYFGGGTPTSFANDELKRVLDQIGSFVELAEGSSITTEAHPLTLLGSNRIQGLRDIGINRLSIGCQTFDQEILDLCNRSNTEAQIVRIVNEVKDVGLSINIDMMTGLPGQTLESVKRDLETLDRVRPTSVEYIRHEIVNPLIVKLYEQREDLVVGDDDLF
jgi:oxygen-independent coproporphyrinogen-3 oxidase